MVDTVFLEKQQKYSLLKAKLSHVFNRNTDSLFDLIYEESKTLPIDFTKYIETEVEFEIKAHLSLAEITDKYVFQSTIVDYMFLEPQANNDLEFRVLLMLSPRNTAIVKTITIFRKQRNRINDNPINKQLWGLSFYPKIY